MSREHVDHPDIVRFAEDRVNLGREDAEELRAQAYRLRDKLEKYLEENPDFELRKMLLSGSLAKGTALKSISDVDVACYVSSESAPDKIADLLDWLATKLAKAFPNFKPEQITRKTYSVSVKFIGTGNEVDIVPILYAGDPQWRGELISQDTGETLMTSIPMHLGFIAKRKRQNERDYAQVVRLLKFWSQLQKQQDPEFRFKSFMVELILASLADGGKPLDDYPEAMASFYTYLASDEFRTTIAFNDYYEPNKCKVTTDPIRIWDPVNCDNNIAKLYSLQNKARICELALEAGDALDSALHAVSKGDTVRYWQKIFGPTFAA